MKIMKYIHAFILVILCVLSSCSKETFDVVEYNKSTMDSLSMLSYITSIEKYGKLYYIENQTSKTIEIPATEFVSGILYLKEIKEEKTSFSFVLSDGNELTIDHAPDVKIRYRLPNISTLRTDGYDIVLKLILADKNSHLRINYGEPNIDGLVCSAFIDFGKGKMGYYQPYMTDEEKSEEILATYEKDIPFEQGNQYTIVASKKEGCIASVFVKDEKSGDEYEFSPELTCYESGITNS